MKKKTDPKIRLPKVTILPSGSAFTRVTINGERICITKDTEEECIAEYLAMKHGVKEAKKKEKIKKKTLDEAVTEYIEKRRRYKSPSTIYGYESYKRNTFQHLMASNVYTITATQWQVAVDLEADEHSPKYVKNAWGLIAPAVEEATGVRPKVQLPEKETNEKPFLDPDQIKVFVEALKQEPIQIQIAALLDLSSLRRSEMLALKPDKIDLKNGVIHVHGARVAGEKGKLVDKKQNKNQTSRRTIPIIPPLRDALKKADLSGEYVITLSGGWICTRINEICATNGLPQVGNHGLRHSFASLAYHLQLPEKISMEIGGWADAGTMHKIYTHLSKNDIAKRSADFTNFFSAENLAQTEK